MAVAEEQARMAAAEAAAAPSGPPMAKAPGQPIPEPMGDARAPMPPPEQPRATGLLAGAGAPLAPPGVEGIATNENAQSVGDLRVLRIFCRIRFGRLSTEINLDD